MKLRRLVYFLLIFAIGIFVVANLGQFKDFTSTLKEANLYILALILLVRYLYYWSNAKYFMSSFKVLDGGVSFKKAFEASIIYNFFNVVIPSGGVSGASYIANKFDKDVGASTATAVQVAYYVFTFIGYFIVLFAGMLGLILSNQFNQVSYRVVLLVVVLIVIGSIVVASIALNYRIAKKVVWKLFGPINWFLVKIKKTPVTHKDINHFMQQFYNSFGELLKSKHKLLAPLWYCFLGVVAEILSIYIVFMALGEIVSPGIVIAGYSLAMITSFTAIFTGGIGVYEAVMTATFVALGLPFSTSFAVVIIYRFIALWLFIPVGLYYYRHREL